MEQTVAYTKVKDTLYCLLVERMKRRGTVNESVCERMLRDIIGEKPETWLIEKILTDGRISNLIEVANMDFSA